MNVVLPTQLFRLNALFVKKGFELRLVGGAVRDIILGKVPHDYDMCTNATPNEMLQMGVEENIHIIPTGLQHGTVTFVLDGETFEITTLRIDKNCDGRHAEVEFTRSFEEDALRRDFTFNAMSMDFNGQVFDYFSGRQDLDNRIIRFVGNPADRIEEDFLRVFRFFRFMGKFSPNDVVTLDPVALEMVKQQWVKDGIKTISVERVWAELRNILSSEWTFHQFFLMDNVGLLDTLGIELGSPWKMSVFFKATVKKTAALARLSMLVNRTDAEAFGRRFKMSLDEIKELVFCADHFCRTTRELKALVANGAPKEWVLNLACVFCNDTEVEAFNPPVFPVTGNDLLLTGMTPGPGMGLALKQMKARWVENLLNDVSLTKENLMEGFAV